MTSKPLLRSKTFWLQILAFASALIPPIGEWIGDNPVEAVSVLAALNVLVRFVTSGKVTLLHDGTNGAGSGSGGTSLLMMLAVGGLALSGVALLPSCSVLDSAITGTPIPSTTVQRAGQPDAQPVQIASGDLAVAEEQARQAEVADEAPPVHGLYDAGRAAKAAREVFIEPAK